MKTASELSRRKRTDRDKIDAKIEAKTEAKKEVKVAPKNESKAKVEAANHGYGDFNTSNANNPKMSPHTRLEQVGKDEGIAPEWEVEVEDENDAHITHSKYSDVLLIVTGGTLCMVQTDNGYEPARDLA